ncbi:calcium uniporter protein, partial [Tanacetum coccineum]
DWAVGFAIGLIASSDWSSILIMESKNLYSFWASFLLVHLGGPDTITSFVLEDNELWLCHLLGIMKYAERTRAFYLASSDRFKDSIIGFGDSGGNYVNLINEYVSRVKLNILARIVKLPGKGIISYIYLSQKERSQSRHFFLNRTARDGFKVVEVELNFIYDTFFTKLPVVYNIFGVISRFLLGIKELLQDNATEGLNTASSNS